MNRLAPKEAERILLRLTSLAFKKSILSQSEEEQIDMRMLESGWSFDGWTYARDVPCSTHGNGQYACMFRNLRSDERKWLQTFTVNFADIGARFKDLQEELSRKARRAGRPF